MQTERAEATIRKLVAEDNRRSEPRVPFFRRASITRDCEPWHRYSVFTREISTTGVGLQHQFNVHLEPINLWLEGESVPLRVEILWSEPCGDGWYISGGRFT
jgi:hypothetical protein